MPKTESNNGADALACCLDPNHAALALEEIAKTLSRMKTFNPNDHAALLKIVNDRREETFAGVRELEGIVVPARSKTIEDMIRDGIAKALADRDADKKASATGPKK